MEGAAEYATLAVRLVIGLVFLTSAIDKLGHLSKWILTLRGYVSSTRLARALSLPILALEFGISASLLAGLYWRVGLLTAAFLLLAFTFVAARAPAESCGCGGVAELIATGTRVRFRNLALMAVSALAALSQYSALSFDASLPALQHEFRGRIDLAIVVAYLTVAGVLSYAAGPPSSAFTGAVPRSILRSWEDAMDNSVAWVAIAALGAANLVFLLLLLGITRELGIVLVRLGPTGVRAASDGPNVGQAFEPFEIETLDRARVSIAPSKFQPKLLAFVSPQCDACIKLMPGLRTLAAAYAGELTVVAISSRAPTPEDYARRKELEPVVPYACSPELAQRFMIHATP